MVPLCTHFLGHLGLIRRAIDESPFNDIPLAFRYQISAEHGKTFIGLVPPREGGPEMILWSLCALTSSVTLGSYELLYKSAVNDIPLAFRHQISAEHEKTFIGLVHPREGGLEMILWSLCALTTWVITGSYELL